MAFPRSMCLPRYLKVSSRSGCADFKVASFFGSRWNGVDNQHQSQKIHIMYVLCMYIYIDYIL